MSEGRGQGRAGLRGGVAPVAVLNSRLHLVPPASPPRSRRDAVQRRGPALSPRLANAPLRPADDADVPVAVATF